MKKHQKCPPIKSRTPTANSSSVRVEQNGTFSFQNGTLPCPTTPRSHREPAPPLIGARVTRWTPHPIATWNKTERYRSKMEHESYRSYQTDKSHPLRIPFSWGTSVDWESPEGIRSGEGPPRADRAGAREPRGGQRPGEGRGAKTDRCDEGGTAVSCSLSLVRRGLPTKRSVSPDGFPDA
jgi:hypothetical protein